MNRNEFLNRMRYLLSAFPKEDRDEIMYDYEEHFRCGLEAGKSEVEIADALGDVNVIARQFRANFTIKRAETTASASNLLKAVLSTVALGFFNLVFVFGPFVGLVCILFVLFILAIATTIVGFAVLCAVFIALIFPSIISIDMNAGFVIFTSISSTCFGVLLFIGNMYLTKYFFKGTIMYLKWNLSVIKQ